MPINAFSLVSLTVPWKVFSSHQWSNCSGFLGCSPQSACGKWSVLGSSSSQQNKAISVVEIFLSRDHPSAWTTLVAQMEPSWTLETDSHIHYMTPTAVWSYRTSVLSPHPLGMLSTCTLWKTVDSIRPYRGRGHRVYVGIRLPCIEHLPSHCTRVHMASYTTAYAFPWKQTPWTKGRVCIQGYIENSPLHPIKYKVFVCFWLKRLACMMELLRSTTCETGVTCLLSTASKFMILH